MAHIHYKEMMMYATDAAKMDEPYTVWQVLNPLCPNDGWEDLVGQPGWYIDFSYRRKPKTININGYDVPEPVREPLENGDQYHLPSFNNIACGSGYKTSRWGGDGIDMKRLASGIIHLSEEAALSHAKALLSFTENKDATRSL